MTELLSITIFWIFLYLVANGLLIFGYTSRSLMLLVIGEVIATGLLIYSFTIPFSVVTTNWIMIILCVLTAFVGLIVTLTATVDMIR